MHLRQLTLIALFPALLALLAQVSIPLPFSPVPVTGQVVGIFLAAVLLGGRGAFLAVLAYLLLGAAGAPVFALGRGGLAVLLGPTGGYLLGFLPGAYLGGRILEGQARPGSLRTAAAMALCLLCTYLPGTIQLSLVMGLTLPQALLAGALPYLPLDLAKMGLVMAVAPALRAALIKTGFSCAGPGGSFKSPAK